MKHVLICGAGSVGIAIGASLCSQGMDVCFLARKTAMQAILSGGITRTGLFGEIRIPSVCSADALNEHPTDTDNFRNMASTSPSGLTSHPAGRVTAVDTLASLPDGWADYILICTKTLANEEIAALLSENRGKFAPEFVLVIMQNGWGMDAAYLNDFEKSQLYQARVITGFARTAPNCSNITVHTAPILFGSLYGYDTNCVEPLAAAICASGIPSETTTNLSEALWAKMLYNTTLNPLGAILGVPYGKLAEVPESRRIMDRLINETFQVMNACGYRTFWDTPEEYREAFYGKLVPDTYAHRSSTLQDMEKKKKTEIDTLNGCVVHLADAHGIDVPTHRMICELIRALEAGYAP